MSSETINDSPTASTELKDNDAFVATLEDYQFAAALAQQVISGNIYNIQGQTIGTYSYTLTFSTANNVGYLANQVKLSTILKPTGNGGGATYAAGYTYAPGVNANVSTGPVGIDFPISLAGNILMNTGAQTQLNITTVTPLMNANGALGRVAN